MKIHFNISLFFVALLLFTSACKEDRTLLPDPGIVAPNDFNVIGGGVVEYADYEPFEDKPIKLWFFSPKNDPKDSRILFVMHGTGRNAKGYRDSWAKLAREHNILVIVPEFSDQDFPGSRSYNLGNMVDESDRPLPEEQWSFSLIEPIFDYVVNEIQGSQKTYDMYGHSAGAQFTTRYVTFMKDTRINKAICANAGWYTMLNTDIAFPYGLRNSPITDVTHTLNKDVTVLLGENDTDPNDSDLRNTPETLEQGPHRLARGNYFYNHAKDLASSLSANFGWSLVTVPGVSHENKDMAQAAVLVLAE